MHIQIPDRLLVNEPAFWEEPSVNGYDILTILRATVLYPSDEMMQFALNNRVRLYGVGEVVQDATRKFREMNRRVCARYLIEGEEDDVTLFRMRFGF